MSATSSTVTSYDAVPYSSHPYAHSHPRNLAALAKLFGLASPEVRHSRVLEIGCAAGGNLLPMAAMLPEARFLGIDASGRQIQQGQKLIDELALTNIELQRGDILDFDPDRGDFDYIICHGVYSWVPAEVQASILEICQRHLAPNGVAYVSYNTYPGWYLRRGVREMMHYHVQGFEDTQEKIDQSRALIEFLGGAVQSDGSAHAMLLDEELQVLSSCEDSYLFHEHLENHNEPLFFYQFAQRASDHNLRFLCEAQLSTMLAGDFSEEVQQTLESIAPDIIRMEQYLDFVRNRKFRQTLLCHADVELDRTIESSRIEDLFVAIEISDAETEQPSGDAQLEGEGKTFEHSDGQLITVTTPIEQYAFGRLAQLWPQEIAVNQLIEEAWQATPEDQRPGQQQALEEVGSALLQCYSAGLAQLYSVCSGAVSTVSQQPTASSLVRYQADYGPLVTNARHQSVSLNDFDRLLVVRLDGTKTVEQLIQEVCGLISNGELTVELEGISEPSVDDLETAIENNLKRMASLSLLIA